MAFGKRQAYDANATETLAQAAERAKSHEVRDAFLAVAEWAGPNTVATVALRANVAEILTRA